MDNFNNGQQGYQQPTGQPMQQPMGGQPMQPMGSQPMGGQPMGSQPMGGQPMQPMGSQPMGGQPMQPMGGQPMQPMGGQPMQQGYQQPMGGQPMQQGYQQPMGGQPMQQGYQQMGGYQQPMNYGKSAGGANIGGYFSMLGHDNMRLIGFIASILITIAPLFNWLSLKIKYDSNKNKQKANMFKLASDDYLDEGIFVFFALMIMLAGICLIVWDMADYVPAINNLKLKLGNIPMAYILLAVALLFGLLAFFNGDLMDGIKDGKDIIKTAKEWSDEVKGHVNHGFGPILLWIGIAGKAVATFMSTNKQPRAF